MKIITRIIILLTILFVCRTNLTAQSINFDTTSITPELRKNANKVVRNENIEFEVTDIDQARLHVYRLTTVLNKNGSDALEFTMQTDKFNILDDIEIKVYDAAGKIINKYKLHDINVISGVEEFIDDYKTYYLKIRVPSYPVTIETNYKIKYKGSLNYPTYHIIESDEGIENSSFTARINKAIDLRYKEKNINLQPNVSEDGEFKTYTWSVKNMSPIQYEENAVSFENRYPSILLAPNKFKLDKYSGDLSSWKNFGLWYNELLNGVDTLSVQRKEFYREMVKNATSDLQKEKILYNYLQNNFRYVSIQLGIGGFKPISAAITDTKKYGDCKGLSNYMVAVLRSVGIKSYLAVVNAENNEEPADPAFPCNKFNHVIVCIPGKKDSTWLECTSRTSDFGVLGSFTENRNALLITENGGVLVPTPGSRAEENVIRAFTTIDLHDDGSGKTNTIFSAHGEYKDELLALKDEKIDEQKLVMIHQWGFRDPDQIKFDTSDPRNNLLMDLNQQLESIPELKTTNKMFLRPSILNLWVTKLPKSENRKQDFYFACPFLKIDTTLIKLPAGYTVDALPQSVTDSCKYANYLSKSWYDEKTHQVYSITKVMLINYKIPANDYAVVKKFFDGVLLGNEERIVVKKE
jgi:arsenate reductase-like glutaredoxin family protein